MPTEVKSYDELENEIRIEIYLMADKFHKWLMEQPEQVRLDILHRAEECRKSDKFTTRTAAEILRYAATKE